MIAKLEAQGAVFCKLDPPATNRQSTGQTERNLTVELTAAAQPGTVLPLTASLTDRGGALTFASGLEITGPLPAVASSKLSLPAGIAIAVRPGEFPAGYTLNAMLDVKNIERGSILRLACADGVGDPTVLHVGEQNGSSNLQQLSQDQLFLAFDTSRLPAGCSLQAVIDNGRDGRSQPSTLAHILRVPQIDSFTLSGAPRTYQLTGQNLEMIEKAGWDEKNGVELSGLPVPLPGPGLKQSVEVVLPDPVDPEAVLYVWLRGDGQGRASSVHAPPLPPAPAAAPPAVPVLITPQ